MIKLILINLLFVLISSCTYKTENTYHYYTGPQNTLNQTEENKVTKTPPKKNLTEKDPSLEPDQDLESEVSPHPKDSHSSQQNNKHNDNQEDTLVQLYTTRPDNYFIQIEESVHKIYSIANSLNLSFFDLFKEKSVTESNQETKTQYSLLQFFKDSSRQVKVEDYTRKRHFGGWVKDYKKNECMNTRAKVLIRDNIGQIEMNPENPCSVIKGEWVDPYSGQKMTDALNEIQIDHMVPLKVAYISGGYKWNYQERCLYGNYMGYKNHLISALGTENNQKSDQTPENYMPPLESYKCQYLKDWLSIKAIWGLSLSETESKSIQDLIEKHNCSKSDFVISKVEIQKQIQFFKENSELCRDFGLNEEQRK